MSPMEWRPRTATRSGKFSKMILEEIPPRIIMKGHETYEDLVKIGSEKFWPGRCSQSEFTLCHQDGTRWTVDEFLKEFKTVSDITTPWKRTIYIGRKELVYLPRVPYVDCSLINFDEGVLLGQGTFGNVYGGSFQGTPAAIKKIMLGGAKDTEHDIHHEINVSLRLSHPNIVRLLAAARTETYFLLATEYIHGAPLEVVINSDSSIVKLEGQDDDFIALDLAMAMEYIHGQKVIHQDIKPANVMVHLQAKRAVLTDWGLANIRDTVQLRQGSRLQAQGVGPIGGTYLYMAPECILHFEEASYWTDMVPGATYVELFTRSSPWVVKKQRELSALMAANMPPHAVDKLDESQGRTGNKNRPCQFCPGPALELRDC
ncbi:putative cysteine-rich receptor-like protein kinase 43 [Merluccius polli]|uniref:Cysteine-rich receptor-like protein kinase 43 n=1 Tax=Merluccius polli TaxID=89951 RepID=A0AA47NZN6_MERPO|nr:putative cysteine-rich receptor-like protein kinase 43 [Merluccius polli]